MSSLAVYLGATEHSRWGKKASAECSHVESVEPDQSVMFIMQVMAGGGVSGDDVQADTAQSTGNVDSHSPGWRGLRRSGTAGQDTLCF